MSIIIRRVTRCISIYLAEKYIKLPNCERDVERLSALFFEKHGFPQCIGAVHGTHIGIQKPRKNATDFINRKGRHTINCQAVADYRYCFLDVVIKWPGSVHDARVFSTSSINEKFREGSIPPCKKVIVEGMPAIPICILGDAAYPLLPYVMKEFANNGKNEMEQFFGWRLSSARMVIECAFGRLKGRFGCLKRDMYINMNDLPFVIHSCFKLHNFCEMRKENVSRENVESAMKYDKDFQPPSEQTYKINNNEGGGKKIRSVFVKYFE